jgi:hypothetical protein
MTVVIGMKARKAAEANSARLATIHDAAEADTAFASGFFGEPSPIADPDMRIAAIVRHTLQQVTS